MFIAVVDCAVKMWNFRMSVSLVQVQKCCLFFLKYSSLHWWNSVSTVCSYELKELFSDLQQAALFSFFVLEAAKLESLSSYET